MNQARRTELTVLGWILFFVLATIVIFQFARQDKIDAVHVQLAEQARKIKEVAAAEQRQGEELKAQPEQAEPDVQEALKACQEKANDKRWARVKAVNQTNADGLTHTDLNELDKTSYKMMTEELAACDKQYGAK